MYKKVDKFISRVAYWLNKRVYRGLSKSKLLRANTLSQLIVIIITVFLLSGGIALLVNPNLQAVLVPSIVGGETPLEFTIFFFVNLMFFVSLYMIYSGASKSVFDTGLVLGGIILFIIIIVIDMFLLMAKLGMLR
jgi:hypothetical protein